MNYQHRRVLPKSNQTRPGSESRSTILEAVEMVLRPGEITAVVGESGAGKTTLLRALRA